MSAIASRPRIAILGAGGLIGQALAVELAGRDWPVIAVARRFSPSQAASFERPRVSLIVDLDAAGLAGLLREEAVEIVVNCIGVLQDGPGGRTGEVHEGFAGRLTAAIAASERPILLVHLSVPGDPQDDRTAFSRSKRQAETIIAEAGVPFVILRPGFVVAPAAFGGSALVRALAASPFDLPDREAATDFHAVAVEDIAATVAAVAQRWTDGDRAWSAAWDLMHPQTETMGSVIAEFRRWLGERPRPRLRLPRPLLDLGARAGDAAGRFGWQPPIRSTALAELRRGVTGDPEDWMRETGIAPLSLRESLTRRPATVQEKWFARLYLLKALVFGTLALFWIASGLVPLVASFQPARDILVAAGLSLSFATLATVSLSLLDIGIGIAIAVRRTARLGLGAGIAVATLYLAAASVLTPTLWLDPVGALVKTVPAVVLMLVALALADDR